MKRMILALAGVIAASAAVPGTAQAYDGYYRGGYGKYDRGWHKGRVYHRGWDRGRGWNRGPRWRTVCEWRGRYRPHRVCYRARVW
ncbi:MAG: hypothetical protein QM688_01010 [Sphingomonas bacterium]